MFANTHRRFKKYGVICEINWTSNRWTKKKTDFRVEQHLHNQRAEIKATESREEKTRESWPAHALFDFKRKIYIFNAGNESVSINHSDLKALEHLILMNTIKVYKKYWIYLFIYQLIIYLQFKYSFLLFLGNFISVCNQKCKMWYIGCILLAKSWNKSI